MGWNKSLLILLATSVVACATAWGQRSAPAVRTTSYGTIWGRVNNSAGMALTGVPVIVTRQDGLFVRKVYTQANGRFDLSRLVPGLYAVEVSLPDFLPFSKAPVSVKAGAEVLVNVSLRSLAESLEIGLPGDPGKAREDWKWALRTASPTRPILRFQDANPNRAPGESAHARLPLRGTVLVSAGNESRSFGADPGLRTSFDVAYDWTSRSSLAMAGSAGWERGTPAASLRTAWQFQSDNGTTSLLSATVRQLYLPNAYGREFSVNSLPGHRIQSFSGRYEINMALSERLSLRYGALFDRVSLNTQVSQWSPFGQLTYAPDEETRWKFTYTAESPRLLPSNPVGPTRLEEALAIPQISTDVLSRHRAALESGRHLEAGWERTLGFRYRVEAATFYDSLSDLALSIAPANSTIALGLLRDPFSDTRFLDGGDYSAFGVRASVGARLFASSELVLGYAYGGGLQAAIPVDVVAEKPNDLRAMIRTQKASSFTVKLRSTMPRSRTEVTTSYEWLPNNALMAIDPYSASMGRSEPFLNVSLVQPFPRSDLLPGQFQAIADFSNVFAQGYLPVRSPDGTNYFFISPRSFRGGFSFIF